MIFIVYQLTDTISALDDTSLIITLSFQTVYLFIMTGGIKAEVANIFAKWFECLTNVMLYQYLSAAAGTERAMT